MSGRRGPADGNCEGEDYRDFCAAPAACPCCTLWPAPGEDRTEWYARIRAAYRDGETHRERIAS